MRAIRERMRRVLTPGRRTVIAEEARASARWYPIVLLGLAALVGVSGR